MTIYSFKIIYQDVRDYSYNYPHVGNVPTFRTINQINNVKNITKPYMQINASKYYAIIGNEMQPLCVGHLSKTYKNIYVSTKHDYYTTNVKALHNTIKAVTQKHIKDWESQINRWKENIKNFGYNDDNRFYNNNYGEEQIRKLETLITLTQENYKNALEQIKSLINNE